MATQEKSPASQSPLGSIGAPVLVIVIPVYGHPSLLIEALESALKQRTASDYRILLVNDGCPLAQTHRICSTYATAYPERLVYLRKQNGGPSAARNHGVQAGLTMWPTVRAFFFLDADNRLHPGFVEQAYAALHEYPQAGWIFPDIAFFGAERALVDLSAPFSRLELLLHNYCEMGSLVRREVFEAGVRFDESCHSYEDWDFWLQAMTRGFVGQHSSRLRFWYRKRRESRLADDTRDLTAFMTYLRRKYPDLYTVRYAMTAAAGEGPHWAFWLPDVDRVLLASTAAEAEESVNWAEFTRRLRRWRTFGQWERCPSVLVVASQPTLDILRRHALLAHLLWAMEADLEKRHISSLTIEQRLSLEWHVQCSTVRPATLEDLQRAAVCMLSVHRLDAYLCRPQEDSLESLGTAQLQSWAVTRHLLVESTASPSPVPSDVITCLSRRVQAFGPQHRTTPAIRTDLGRRFDRRSHDVSRIIRDLWGCSTPPSLRVVTGQRHIGFVLPRCDIGEDERVMANIARACKRLGFAVHLCVIGSEHAYLLPEFASTFDSICLLPDLELASPPHLLSLLGCMDVVIHHPSAPLHGVLGDLRRQGTKLITQFQMIDPSIHGIPGGASHVVLEYEHVLDRIIVPSRKLVTWLQAWGIPEDKILFIPNGPGFEVPPARVTAALLDRRQRVEDAPLRVLFMAYFDRQRSLDRLVDLLRLAKSRGARCDWRIVDKPVVEEHEELPIDLEALRPWLWPPALDTQSLMAYYAWADVLLLPSHGEGSPVSILEAQSLGCVPLATACGAVDEHIKEGVTGYLFDRTASTVALSTAMLDRLVALQEDRSVLLHLAEQAATARQKTSWCHNINALAGCLTAWFPAQEAVQNAHIY